MQFDHASPIWSQLVHECSRRIVTGQWPEGSKVPTVRDLAIELGVNPNTMQRALGELDRLGVTVSERTVGRFVTEDSQRINTLRSSLAEESVHEFIRKVQGLGATLTVAQELLATHWDQEDEE